MAIILGGMRYDGEQMQGISRKQAIIYGLAAAVIGFFVDQYLMSEQLAKEENIILVIKSDYDTGAICTDAPAARRILCLAEKLSSYRLTMGSAPVLEAVLTSTWKDAFDKAQSVRDKQKLEEDYCLAISFAFSRVLQRAQASDMLRPSELYARKAFLERMPNTLARIKEVTERIQRTYQDIGAAINLGRVELSGSYVRLRSLAAQEASRSEIHAMLTEMLP